MAGEGEGHFAIVVLLATAGSHLKNTKLLKERSKKPRWTGDCRCRGRLYPELCVILRQEQGICFLRAFNSMSRIVRPNHRLGGDYTCIPACTHEHTFVSDGGGGVGIGVLHCFLTHFMTRTIARLDFVKVARGVTEVMLGRVICLFRICMI